MDAVRDTLTRVGNPSSVHAWGNGARRSLDRARSEVANLVGSDEHNIIFTSGGTEANAIALNSAGSRRILASAIEHTSILASRAPVERVPVTEAGLVDLAALEESLARSPEPALVAVMLANNETGVIQPVGQVVTIAHHHCALVHCDAVQAVGRIPFSMADLGVDFLALSGHKIGGIPGAGALVLAPSAAVEPVLRGGGQERNRRAGTENIAGIVALGAAAAALDPIRENHRLLRLRDRIESELASRVPDARIIGATAPRLPNTTCLTMPDVPSEVQVIAFDLAGVGISAGAACSSGKVARSHVLSAMGLGEDLASCAVRVSLGWTTTEDDVERFIETWCTIFAQTRATARAATAA
jgi:cysteine desulfurase